MTYGYKRQVNLPYNQVAVRVREELGKEGFGVLTDIDVKATLKKKLNVENDNLKATAEQIEAKLKKVS
jgi:uncharacterized protein (DUF302 family)